MALTEEQAPFTEPYALAGNESGFKSKGNTALAVKRALAHLGFLKWEPDKWDKQWNQKVNDAAAKWKQKRGLIPASSHDGSWGKKAHDLMRSTWYEKSGDRLDAFDGESQDLLKEEKKASGGDGSNEDKVRGKLTEFAERAIAEPDWAYTQNRAIDVSVNPEGPNESDCSGSTIQGFHYAKRETGLNVQDPAQQGWSGYGNTNYYEDDWPTVTDGKYREGDLAHYDGHVTYCYRAGDSHSADWFSFGSEPPSSRKLNYRSDFRKVVRPKLLA
jgi:hypothetical protein